jgi:hypothetical protein
VTRQDGEIHHDVSIVSAVRNPEMIAQRIINKPTVVDIAQILGEPR